MSIYVGVKYLNDKRFSLMFSFYIPSFNSLTYNFYWQPIRWWTGNSHQKECRMQRFPKNRLSSRTGFLKNSNFPWGLTTTTSLHVLSYFFKGGSIIYLWFNLLFDVYRKSPYPTWIHWTSIHNYLTIFVQKLSRAQKAWFDHVTKQHDCFHKIPLVDTFIVT